MNASGFFVSAPALLGCQWELCSCGMVGLICGSVWQLSPLPGRYLCQSTVNFMLLLLKHWFPNRASSSSHWLNFSIWSCARFFCFFFFSLGNHVLHQKIYCHKKTKLFLRALFGIWNSSPSLELNFSSDAYSRNRQISMETVHCAVRRARILKPFPHPSRGVLR